MYVLNGPSALDGTNGIVYVQLAQNKSNTVTISLVAIDLSTGKVDMTVMTPTQEMATMDYDVKTGRIYGLGFDEATRAHTLAYYDPKTKSFGTVGDISGYFMEEGWFLSFCRYIIVSRLILVVKLN